MLTIRCLRIFQIHLCNDSLTKRQLLKAHVLGCVQVKYSVPRVKTAKPPERSYREDRYRARHIPHQSVNMLYRTVFLLWFQFRTLHNSNRNFWLSALNKTVQFLYSYLQNEFCRCNKNYPAFLFTSADLTVQFERSCFFWKAKKKQQKNNPKFSMGFSPSN